MPKISATAIPATSRPASAIDIGRAGLRASASAGAATPARNLLIVLVAGIMLCAAAVVNRQPFFFQDSTAYVRGAELGLTKVFGDRFRTAFSELDSAAPPIPASSAKPARDAVRTTADPAIAAAVTARGNEAGNPSSAAKSTSLNSPESKVVLAGRSVYYGALLYLSYVTSDLWLTVAVQALAVAYVLHLLMVRLWRQPPRVYAATVAALVVATPLSGFVGLLMPDIFAPLVILATGTLALYWKQLGKADRALLGFIVLAALVSHASHILITLFGMIVLVAALRWGRAAWKPAVPALVLIAVLLVASFGAEWIFNRAVVKAIGESPLRLPYLMARLIDVGPGTDYLKATCPGSGYTACKWVQNYPTDWEVFMFTADPAHGAFALASTDEKRRISAEQFRFFFDVLRRDPVGVLKSMASGGIGQLLDFRMHIFRYSPKDYLDYSTRLPPPVFHRLENTVIAGNPAWSVAWEWVSYLSAALGLVACIVFVRRGRTTNDRSAAMSDDGVSRVMAFCAYVACGVVVNALVCGALASPYDRFQARVVWLIPLIAIVLWRMARPDGRRAIVTNSQSMTDSPESQRRTT